MKQKASIEELAKRAEALLFIEGGTLNRRKLATLLACSPEELEKALDVLSERLKGSGLSLVRSETEASLTTSGETSEIVQEAIERELNRDIGDAGLEVLTIVIYMGPSTRARIDYIRGVNSASTLRNLLARGLIERTENPKDAREYLYRPTVETMAHLGVTQSKEASDYDTIVRELSAFEHKNELFKADGNQDTA